MRTHEQSLGLTESSVYYDFPVFKDLDNDIIISQLFIISRLHGILLVSFNEANDIQYIVENEPLMEGIEQLHSIIFSRMLRNKMLRKSKTELLFPINSFIFNNVLNSDGKASDVLCITSFKSLEEYLISKRVEPLDVEVYQELIATIEGAKGLLKPKERSVGDSTKIKGLVATEIEKEINSFDEFQKKAFINEIKGPERIRGLAGSGKTVVLALKAAITHLRDPEATIVYTFYTKSLYQHIQRLITRFYRQYDDKDPDWTKLKIIHAWGSSATPGIYYDACVRNQLEYLNFSQAAVKDPDKPFDYVCRTILKEPAIQPIYDYIFIDEGQDFPESFIKLCLRLCFKGRIVWAYDELQTIFQAKTPKIESILTGSPYSGLEEDIILYKCYRNPREVLVPAHALGFGIYGNIVQMLDETDYWNDIGYKVIEGNFKEGEKIVIERPAEYSLETVSKNFAKTEIVKFRAYQEYTDELRACFTNIINDLDLGLRADDILVIVADDLNAKGYLADIQYILQKRGIKCNNIHSDKFSVKDFTVDNHVTLSTIHKAKGNEAYSVHILGVDSLYSLQPSVRERNLMFTAMTRTKGWVNISGIGPTAGKWMNELTIALEKFPNMEFVYPNEETLNLMKRDIQESATRKSKQAKMLDELLAQMSPEEIKQFLDQREIKKRKK